MNRSLTKEVRSSDSLSPENQDSEVSRYSVPKDLLNVDSVPRPKSNTRNQTEIRLYGLRHTPVPFVVTRSLLGRGKEWSDL